MSVSEAPHHDYSEGKKVVEPGVGGDGREHRQESGDPEPEPVDNLAPDELGQPAPDDLGGDVTVPEGAQEQAPLE